MIPQPGPGGLSDVVRAGIERSNATADRRILIRGGTVLSLDAQVGDHRRADVLVAGGRIEAIHPDLDDAHDSATLVLDAWGTIVVPGFVDAHRHLWHSILRQLTEEELGAPVLDAGRRLGPECRPDDRYAATRLGALASLDGGITTVHELAFGATADDVLAGAQALADTGLRAVVAAAPSDHDLAHVQAQVAATAPHHLSSSTALRTLDDLSLARARAVGALIVVDGAIDPAPSTTLTRLGGRGLLDHDIVLTHATRLRPDAWDALGAAAARVVVCPTTEHQDRPGPLPEEPPVQQALNRRMSIALGTDVRCREARSMFVQMRALATHQRMDAFRRLRAEDPTAPRPLSPRHLLHLATLGGADLLGLADRTGSLTPGKVADLVLIDVADPARVPTIEEAYERVVLGAGVEDVDSVLVGGVVHKARGELVGHDVARIGADADASRDHLRRVAAQRHLQAGRPGREPADSANGERGRRAAC